jgi:hypothetical protein
MRFARWSGRITAKSDFGHTAAGATTRPSQGTRWSKQLQGTLARLSQNCRSPHAPVSLERACREPPPISEEDLRRAHLEWQLRRLGRRHGRRALMALAPAKRFIKTGRVVRNGNGFNPPRRASGRLGPRYSWI